MTTTRRITAAINRSSLGSPAARKLRARTSVTQRVQIKQRAAARESTRPVTKSKR
jgi:hypothetical protein